MLWISAKYLPRSSKFGYNRSALTNCPQGDPQACLSMRPKCCYRTSFTNLRHASDVRHTSAVSVGWRRMRLFLIEANNMTALFNFQLSEAARTLFRLQSAWSWRRVSLQVDIGVWKQHNDSAFRAEGIASEVQLNWRDWIWVRSVFLNSRATARYRALTSIIPGRERLSWNLSF